MTERDLRAPAPTGWARHREPTYLEIVIPALDEERRLPQTISAAVEYLETRGFPSSVVVVDNGSVDRTPDIVRRAGGDRVPVHLVGCSDRGKGAAVRRGVLTGRSTMVGFCDADLATPFSVLDQVLPLLEAGTPVVVGSRHVDGATVRSPQPPVRRLGGWAFRNLAHAVVPDVCDTQCGFKFFHGAIGRRLLQHTHVEGFAFDVELLALARQSGFEIAEVPVPWSDVEGSSFHALRDGIRSVSDVLEIRTRHAKL